MPEENNQIIYFGETNFRNQRRKFGIRPMDRRKHFYIVGKTGMGKTTLLDNMAIQDIQNGQGVGVVDPHGELAERLLDFVPSNRVNDVIYFNPSDLEYPIAFNAIEQVDTEHRHLVASGLMGVFKKIWPDVWSARMEYILNNAILALLEYPGSTLLGINRILADADYRRKVVERLTDPVVKAFWVNEFARYNTQFQTEAIAPIQNKVGQFISAALIRNIIGQTRSAIDMRQVMDNQKILILNLSKGKMGEDNSRLLGAMIITKLYLSAMSRVDMPEAERKDFYLYVDEFQNFATESFASILSEARKYRLSLTLAHQYIAQMDERVRDAVFGNVGTLLCFRVGAADAQFLEKEFEPEFIMNDLVNLGFASTYLKLMIDGITSRPFSAATLPPQPLPQESHKQKIINVSRERYGTKRSVVEEKITKWSGLLAESVQRQPGPAPTIPLYDAICSKCGKKTKVVFEPEQGRPVYCKECLKKIRRAQQADREAGREPERGRHRISPPSNRGEIERGGRRSEEDRNKSFPRRRPDASFFPQPPTIPQTEVQAKAALSPAQGQLAIKSTGQAISLKKAIAQEPVYFGRKKPTPDSDQLREAIKEAKQQI